MICTLENFVMLVVSTRVSTFCGSTLYCLLPNLLPGPGLRYLAVTIHGSFFIAS